MIMLYYYENKVLMIIHVIDEEESVVWEPLQVDWLEEKEPSHKVAMFSTHITQLYQDD